ncbi:hypothetical protein CRYUN_Cryun19dG0152100 [Craigia yunnanensis]
MCLKDCSELYSDAGSSLQSASHSVESKAYGAATFTLSAALTDSDTCEEKFKEKEWLVSLLSNENNDFFQLTAIPLAFASMLRYCDENNNVLVTYLVSPESATPII